MGNLTLGQKLVVVGILSVFDVALLLVLLLGPDLFTRGLAALGLFVTVPLTVRFVNL
jgi:hypothetical protein